MPRVDLVPLLAAGPEDATWGIEVRREDSVEPVVEHGATTVLRTASVAKVFVLVELAHRIEDGTVGPRGWLDRRSLVPVADSGLWQHLATDRLMVEDAARLVGAVSDNLATNALIHLLGLERVQERATAMAPGGSMLHDLVRDERPDGGSLSTGCARDWAAIMQRLEKERRRGEPVGAGVVEWLVAGTDLSMVAGAFDLDPLAHGSGPDEGVTLWNKTGTDPGVRADVGVVAIDDSWASYAVICNWPGEGAADRSRVLRVMRGVGEKIRLSLR